MPSATEVAKIMTALLLSACGGSKPRCQEHLTPPAVVAHDGRFSSAPTLTAFDRVVTLEVIFPEPNVRAMYESLAPEQQGERRSYAFALKAQPGMQKDRHFHFITVTVTPKDDSAKGSEAAGGPSGGFVQQSFETPDGRFSGTVSEGMLLPSSVSVPPFELERAVQSIIERYQQRER